MRAHSLTAPPGGARISLCYLKTSVHAHAYVIYKKKKYIFKLDKFLIYYTKKNYTIKNNKIDNILKKYKCLTLSNIIYYIILYLYFNIFSIHY